MTQDDDPVETVVYQGQQAAKKPDEIFHRSSSSFALASTTRASDRGPVEIKEISNIFWVVLVVGGWPRRRIPALLRYERHQAARKWALHRMSAGSRRFQQSLQISPPT